MRKTYRNRMEALCAEMRAVFAPQEIKLQGLHTGLHLLLTLPGGPGAQAMVELARTVGANLQPLHAYYQAQAELCPPDTVVLGYANLDPNVMRELAYDLKSVWCKAE